MSTRDDLRQALTTALRSRDRVALAALRSLQAALDNAEAVAVDSPAATTGATVAGGVVGLGAAEVARRELTDDEVAAVVDREIAERREAAATYRAAGADAPADRSLAKAEILERLGADRV